ncbi:MAG TPA: CpsB/CapC family capsule biosynthesis tyrosine phosphatase [Longimicrobiales bacterium]
MVLTDFHNHLIPGVDDGAQTVDESRGGVQAMFDSGVRALVATPHLQGSLTRQPEALAQRLAELDAGWARLEAEVAPGFPELRLHRGAEVMLDTPEPDLSDPRVRLAGGPFVLVEFPYMTVPPQAERVISAIRLGGWTPIIAHPERYNGLDADARMPGEWRRLGAYLQVNAGSVLGRYGDNARRVALTLLQRGWADYIASDYHARGRAHLRACRSRLEELGGAEQVGLLMEANPARVLEGEPPIPVAPLRTKRGLWARLTGVFR